ncbi:MAG: hypothetical protein HN392_01320 [Anaerolineae bacterium]|jgi:hypothetical protein|nr:hypothetical protein [Anaerolineae bacterium]MBT7783506.1 hypothetical protein [Anaerolineae bacterium]
MKKNHYPPDSNRISVLVATVLLAFALARLLSTSAYVIAFEILGRVIRLEFDLRIMVILLASGLTATGMDWLLRSHPLVEKKRRIEHWFVPMLTALVLGVLLELLPLGTLWWWVGFAVSGILLVLVFWAEYVVVSAGDTSYPVATVLLTVISFALYLILVLALRYANLRLFLMAPAFFTVSFFVSLRTLHLRFGQRWEGAWSVGIALVVVQVAAGLHYLPISPIRYGVLLLGPLYALVALAASLLEGFHIRRAMVEPIVMLILIWSAGIWLG